MQSIYLLICKLYSIIFSFLERVLFKKKDINKKLFYKFDQIHLNKINYENFQIIKKNEYLDKIIFPKHNIIENDERVPYLIRIIDKSIRFKTTNYSYLRRHLTLWEEIETKRSS